MTTTERAARDAHVAADGALLFLLHALLRSHWSPVATVSAVNGTDDDDNQQQQQSSLLEPHAFAGNVSLLPAVVYDVPRDTNQPHSSDISDSHVHVRAIRVQHKLYVHFVSSRATLRLDLVVSEYVRAARAGDDANVPSVPTSNSRRARVARVGDWTCQYELLRWRLERSVLSAFGSATAAPRVAMAAELAQLSEPLLTRVCAFLQVRDFVRTTQTNKSMRQLADNQELWRAFLQHDFPPGNASDARAAYVELYKYHASFVRDFENYLRRERLGLRELEQRCGGLAPRMPCTPQLLPPSLFDLAVFGERRRLDDDDDLRLPFDA